jgi:hypothetical protein
VCSVEISAWVLSRVARAVDSGRARLRVGFLVVSLTMASNVGSALVAAAIPATSPPQAVVAGLLSIALVRRCFELSFGRTWAPFGAHVALTVVQFPWAIFVIRPYVAEAFVVPTKIMPREPSSPSVPTWQKPGQTFAGWPRRRRCPGTHAGTRTCFSTTWRV